MQLGARRPHRPAKARVFDNTDDLGEAAVVVPDRLDALPDRSPSPPEGLGEEAVDEGAAVAIGVFEQTAVEKREVERLKSTGTDDAEIDLGCLVEIRGLFGTRRQIEVGADRIHEERRGQPGGLSRQGAQPGEQCFVIFQFLLVGGSCQGKDGE